MEEKKPRSRGQVIPLGQRSFGIRVPLKERGTNGRHKTHYETIHDKTPKQAEKYKDNLLARIEVGTFFVPQALTVSELIDEWLKSKERQKLKPDSLYTYGDVTHAYLRPHIGHLELAAVSGATIRDLYITLQDKGLSTGTIGYVRKLLKMIFKDARSWGYLQNNPADSIPSLPGAAGREACALDVKQAQALIETCSLDLKDLLFVFALMTGLRPEEYLGLAWPQLRLVSQEIEGRTIERGLVEVRQVAVKLRKGGWVFLKPKSKRAVRDVPFPAQLYHDLLRYKRVTDWQQRVMGQDWHDHELVFPSRNGNPLSSAALEQGRFKTLLKRAGLPEHFTLYSLRYTFATLQMLSGERDKVIAELMGHTRVNFNMDVYQKVLPVMRERASDGLEKLLFPTVRTIFAQSQPDRLM